MLKQNIPPQLLTEAKEIDSVVKNTLDSLGMHLYSTLTWGAAIGAFIGPAKAVLANQTPQVTPENYVLLATALAAATFQKLVSKEHQQEINDKLEERGLVSAFEKADDEVGTIRKVMAWFANAMGKGVDEILGIASFTAFFTPIVEYIASVTGVVDIPDPMTALKLIMTSVGVEALRSFIKYVMGKDRETVQSLRGIDSTLARAKEKQVDVDISDLQEMIDEVNIPGMKYIPGSSDYKMRKLLQRQIDETIPKLEQEGAYKDLFDKIRAREKLTRDELDKVVKGLGVAALTVPGGAVLSVPMIYFYLRKRLCKAEVC